ncbi:MAG: colicin E3/pyocin S6 family cytotoxin [Clostridia bacterium]|nr:colicin E3/pyocin S6 family cytotoxin [Clostridia bacterium]
MPLIIFGTNMAFEGIQDLWYTLRGELDHESKNLIKEATGHKVDNLVELSEIGMSIYAGKVASKKITGKLGEESEKLSGLLKKVKKPASSFVSRSRRLVKKFMPKKRYRKFKVVDIEELSKKQGLISLTESELENTIGGAKDPNWKPNNGKGSQYGFNVTEEGNVRKFNIKKQESSIWKNFENVKGKDRKCSGFGKNKNYYEWDYTHNDIEVYDCRGRHLGSLNPITGELYKPAVDGRNITI